MNRRELVQTLLIGIGSLIVDPKRLLPPMQSTIFRDVEVFIGNEYHPISFGLIQPNQWFRFVDDPHTLLRCIAPPIPCEPTGNYTIMTDMRINIKNFSGVTDVSLAI